MEKGGEHSLETRSKISKSLKNIPVTPETRSKIKESRRQNTDKAHKEEIERGTRICPRCAIEKHLLDFSQNGKFRDGSPRYAYCKLCRAEFDREKRLRNFFLMSIEEADAVFAFQGNLCAICKRAPVSGKRLALDHRHSDGLVRGGLCSWCNRAIARFHDNVVRLRSAADYLENPPAVKALGREHFARPGRIGTKKQRALVKREKKAKTK